MTIGFYIGQSSCEQKCSVQWHSVGLGWGLNLGVAVSNAFLCHALPQSKTHPSVTNGTFWGRDGGLDLENRMAGNRLINVMVAFSEGPSHCPSICFRVEP